MFFFFFILYVECNTVLVSECVTSNPTRRKTFFWRAFPAFFIQPETSAFQPPLQISVRARRDFHKLFCFSVHRRCKHKTKQYSFKNDENVFQENMEICDDLSVKLSTSVKHNETRR